VYVCMGIWVYGCMGDMGVCMGVCMGVLVCGCMGVVVGRVLQPAVVVGREICVYVCMCMCVCMGVLVCWCVCVCVCGCMGVWVSL